MQKTKKGNVAVIAIIIAIVAITAGIVGWKFAKKSQAPVQKTEVIQITQPVQPTSISDSNDNASKQKTEATVACNASTKCGSACVYNGEVYPTRIFSDSCWMIKNINTSTKADGITGIRRQCYNDDTNICDTHGGLYLWADAMGLPAKCNTSTCIIEKNHQGICPNGWHVSTEDEWGVLENGYSYDQLVNSGENIFGKVLTGERHYKGFDSVDGGTWTGAFIDIDYRGYYWMPKQSSVNGAWSIIFNTYDKTIRHVIINKGVRFSVRCVKNL